MFNLLQGLGTPAQIVMYAFDLLMLLGKDVRLWRLDDRRAQFLEITRHLPDTIRFSETFIVPLCDLVNAVRQTQLEGIVAKRVDSPYYSGERSPNWGEVAGEQRQEFVIGGYVPSGSGANSILPDITSAGTSFTPAASGLALRQSAGPCYRILRSCR